MATGRPQIPRSRTLTPLWVISLFVTLTETVLGVAAAQTNDGVQVALIVFVLVFPLLIAGAFFAILWNRPYVFYPPQEFGREVDVLRFVEAMQKQRNPIDQDQLYTTIQKTIRETFKSESLITELSEISSYGSAKPTEKHYAQILDSAADEAIERIGKEGFLTIDTTPLMGAEGEVLHVPYDIFDSVFRFLSDIFFTLHNRVSPFSYGKQWALRDANSGRVIRDQAVEQRIQEQGILTDRITLKDIGIVPGMRLEVIPLGSQK